MPEIDRPKAPAPLDRGACERVLLRALELQDGDLDCGSLSEADLLEAGAELGLRPEHLRRALAEERARGGAIRVSGGRLERVAGPAAVGSSRVVPRPADELLEQVHEWLCQQEGLRLERRLESGRVFERRGGIAGRAQRALSSAGGHDSRLAKADAVTARVAPLGEGESLLRLEADVGRRRRDSVAGAAALAVAGTAGSVVIAVTASPVALILAAPAAGAGYLVMRHQSEETRRIESAVERTLDALEHGDPARGPLAGVASALGRAMERRRRPAR